ncbi:uncharacterized protein LOC123011412 isoform X2 [Tribolium madens]|uniref:uncharacterized protein LOC123011412 isoform X2 n=1 Tax=Tribolium madens TaxID=41895 RepID=UPI001CF72656|nr:uncharacterized protein LOC123011412 isoform X2 [Tribolium madens]
MPGTTITKAGISRTDKVTQLLCSTCRQITLKTYKFRMTSMKNDRDLKANYVCPNTVPAASNSAPPEKDTFAPNNMAEAPCKTVGSIKYKRAHPSVRKAAHENPGVIIPTKCLKLHIGAYITLLTDEVDEWYKERNYSDAEIAKLKIQAYELAISDDNIEPKKRKLNPNEKKSKKSSTGSLKGNGRLSVDSESSRPESACSNSTDKSNKLTKGQSAVGVKMDVRFVRDNLHTLVGDVDKKVSPEKSDTKCVKNKVAACSKTETAVSVEVLQRKLNTICAGRESVDNPVSDTNKNVLRQNSDVKSNNQLLLKNGMAQLGPILHDVLNKSKQMDKSNEGTILTDTLQRTESMKHKIEVNGNLHLDVSCLAKNIKPKENQREPSPTKEDSGLLTKPAAAFTDYTWLVLSDSEDIERGENCSDSDPVVPDIDSGSTSNDSTKLLANQSTKLPENTDKATFTEALDLVPKNSNMPDLSLVSLVPKSHKLYTCKVCDSQKSSLKELKNHERRIHTKCPFCSKRFRSLVHRDEHVRTSCRINKSPVKLKIPKLQLVRIDEVEEIKKKYLFDLKTGEVNEKEENNAVEKESDSDDSEGRLVICDPATVKAISELENFINETEVVPDRQTPEVVNNGQIDDNNDIICISDEETETPAVQPNTSPQSSKKQMINVVSNELLKKIKIHDTDVNILKRILSLSKSNVDKKTDNSSLLDNPIVNGNTNRIKIFKNLRKHLKRYKIPIQVQYGPTVSVEYKPTKAPPTKKRNDLWFTAIPREIRPLVPKPSPKNTLTYTFFNGQAAVVTTTSNQLVNNASQKVITSPVTTLASTSILLNRTQNICTSSTNNNITNIILVPSNLVSLSTTQGTFPVLSHTNPVTMRNDQPSASTIDSLRSITDALMPPSRVLSENSNEQNTSKEKTLQPAIRVKNLQELS